MFAVMCTWWETPIVELHYIRAVSKCLQKRAGLKALDVVALAAPYVFILINYIWERHLVFKTHERLNCLDRKLCTYSFWIFQSLKSNKRKYENQVYSYKLKINKTQLNKIQ